MKKTKIRLHLWWIRLIDKLLLWILWTLESEVAIALENFETSLWLCKKNKQNKTKLCFVTNRGCSRHSPDGRLMRFPSLSLRRERLNLPFLFLTLGLSLLSWKMRMLSSRSSTLISRSASCCSRRFSSSSWDFCCRAARVSSSSLERNS